MKKGDVLMTEGGDFDKLGRGAIWDEQIEGCIHQNHIFRVRLNRSIIIPEIFETLLLSAYTKRYFLGASKQTTNLASINITQLKNLPVPIPEIEQQTKFCEVKKKHNRIANLQKETERQAAHLFISLLHKAFDGDL